MSDKTITTVEISKAELGKRQSQIGEIWHRLRKNKTAVLGMFIMIAIILMAIFADFLYDYETEVISPHYEIARQAPSKEHPFGTDEMGRDMLARVVHGSRYSLAIGFSTVFFALIAGSIFGSIAGFFGGRTDNIIMRAMDILLAIPGLLLSITIVAALGSEIKYLVLALSISATPRLARVVRGAVLTVRDNEFIEAARAIGCTDGRIIISHVLPNALAPVIVQTTLQVASAILTIAGLSFIGLGVKPPAPEWGSLLSTGRMYIRDEPHMTFFPGLAIMITILALNLLGDGLRDALDPRLK